MYTVYEIVMQLYVQFAVLSLYLCTHNWTLGAFEYPESPVKLTKRNRSWQKEREFIILSSFIFNCIIMLLFKRFCWQNKTVFWDSTRFCVSTLVPKITEDILKKSVLMDYSKCALCCHSLKESKKMTDLDELSWNKILSVK